MSATPRPAAAGYGPVERWLHWATAIAIACMLAMGWTMTRIGGGALQDTLFVAHESLGLVILAVTVPRVAWRAVRGWPALPATVGRHERLAARLVQGALYALLLALPVTGWTLANAFGAGIRFLGLVDVPRLVGKHDAVRDAATAAHIALGWVLVALAVLHAAAALRHHFVKRDAVLAAMLPRR